MTVLLRANVGATAPRTTSSIGRRRRARAWIAVVALGLATTACGGSDEPAEASSAAATTTSGATSTTPTTTVAPTTAPATAATTVATTVAPTTTVAAASTSTTLEIAATEPIAPPVDEHGSEPVIELGTLSIPKLDVEMTMYEGIRLTTFDRGPGHWPGSAMPGENGNVVVGGHRTSANRVFRDVDRLVPGDEIVFRDERGEHVYLVNRVEIVEPTALWIVEPTDTPTVTLFACHPPGSTAQRIVVFADLATTG